MGNGKNEVKRATRDRVKRSLKDQGTYMGNKLMRLED